MPYKRDKRQDLLNTKCVSLDTFSQYKNAVILNDELRRMIFA